MRLTWMAAAVGGLAAVASGQSNFSFQTVFDNTVDAGATTVVGLRQVVLYDGGHVAALGDVDGTEAAIIYSEPTDPGVWDSSVLVRENDALWTRPTDGFGLLDNVAITSSAPGGGVRIHFASFSTGGDYGLFQYDYDDGAAATYGLIDNDTVNGSETFKYDSPVNGSLAYQVNANGQMVLTGTAGGREVIARLSGLTLDELASGSDNIEQFASQSNRRLITPGGNAVIVAQYDVPPTVDRNIDVFETGPGAPTSPLPESFFTGYAPATLRVLAANDTHVIFEAESGGSFGTFLTTGSGSPTLLHTYNGNSLTLANDAALTGNGRVALYTPEPDTGLDTLKYIDLSGSATPQVIASVGTVVQDVQIVALGVSAQSPMINDNGVVVFDAFIVDEGDDIGATARNALLAWAPNGDLMLIADEAQSIMIDGVPVAIDLLMLNNIAMPLDGGIYKDGLNNQNQLAFGMTYHTDPEDVEGSTRSIVVITTVPEPAGVLVLGTLVTAGFGLRRRRGG